ncbi:ARPP-1 family domain-containing protein [Methanobrevibacter smithii]|uniref:ARPP-1 family domain-containing protein n=1 Tax=Methanobrevibacter smithii TaxID=2173 RepID=UPI0037DC5CC5
MNLKHLSLAERQNYENMTVVPILSDTNTPFDILDLKEGLKMGLVKIEECDNSNIEQVKLKNNSISPLILLDGEEIAGSLQNRIISQTMIIAPKSEIKIPVNCSEKGRNTYKSEFHYSNYMANSNTRRKKVYNKNKLRQNVVWSSIDDLEKDKNTCSKTNALRDSYEKNKYDIDSYLKHFKMENNQIGVICIVENKVGLEIFNNHSLYEKYNEMLLRSYIIDSSNKEKINISNKELENILDSINDDSFIKKEAVGLGKYYKISNSYGNGHILIYENNMVHANFFKKIEEPAVNNGFVKNIQNNKQAIC